MIEEFKFYILSLISGVPQFVYEGLLSVFVIGAVILFFSKWRKSGKDIALLLLIEYLFLLYSSTVFLREDWGVIRCELIPFWSGKAGVLSNNLYTMVYWIKETFYTNLRLGQASAASLVLFGIILIFTVIQKIIQKRFDY